MSTHRKGISSIGLSRKLNLRQKTCRYFRKKVTQAMKSSKRYPMEGIVEIDEMVMGQEEGVKGRENDKKKLVIVGMEQNMNKLTVRSIGLERAVGFVGLVNMVYNLFRYEQVVRLEGIRVSNWEL